eukprot:comp15103_c0_seq1/m.22530 comp15103_c0_seq1/g.22530  ORF comp15103_c0_seq1/g.22530 comp15103_c0_seq1/m.22530 type:complete len:174 (-) comp15103_c0_seq1:91-612(-)
MGAGSSQQIEGLEQESNFTQQEIKRLYKRFKKLDKDGSGTISSDEFLVIPELAGNPLVQRVISIFDKSGDGQVDFKEFIQALSIFSVKGSGEEKLQFAFQVYDIDRDGKICNKEMFQVLKMMVGTNLTDVQLQQIVDKTIVEADEDKDGMISFEEFSKMLSNTDLHQKMTIRF